MVFNALPMGTPIRSAFENGGQCESRCEQGQLAERPLLSWSLSKISLAARYLFRAAQVLLSRPMTSSFVTADTRSERLVARARCSWLGAHGGRIGMASRGVIYLLLAYLAFDVARHGSAPTQTSSTGALQELEARHRWEVTPRRSSDRTRLLRSVAALRRLHRREWSHEAAFRRSLSGSSMGSSVSGRRSSLPVIRPVAAPRAIQSPGWRRSWAGRVGPRRSKWPARASWQRAWDWRPGASSTATTRIWPWSTCLVRGKPPSGFWVALEIGPRVTRSPCLGSISSQQR